MAEIVSVNVSCDNLHSDPDWQQRDILSVERKNDGSYRFSNWYTEIPNEFHLYHERFPENAFHAVVEILHKQEKGNRNNYDLLDESLGQTLHSLLPVRLKNCL